MHGRVRFSIVTAVVTTTDREFRVNLPHRRLLCAVRGAAKTPQNAEAQPSTAVGRPTKEKDLLKAHELRDAFLVDGWSSLVDDVVHLPDGRPVSCFVTVRQ